MSSIKEIVKEILNLPQEADKLVFSFAKNINPTKEGYPHWVCRECGISANVLSCMVRYGSRPDKLCFSTSTFNSGYCEVCGDYKEVTESRDFFYPDFSLLKRKSLRFGNYGKKKD